jgi:hypothetical protein
LAERLIASARKKQAVELSVVMSKDLPLTWTGRGTGHHRHPYLKADFLYSPTLGLYHHTHMFDSHAGTHLVPPAYTLPAEGFDNADYPAEVRGWLAKYESQYGPRGTSSMTTEQVPIEWTTGRARVIDVRQLVGTTDQGQWPASPEITPDHIRAYESDRGPLESGDVVIFQTGHTDKFLKALTDGKACIADPVNARRASARSPLMRPPWAASNHVGRS